MIAPFVAAERGYIDDVIMLHSTRRRVAHALAMLRDKHVELPARPWTPINLSLYKAGH